MKKFTTCLIGLLSWLPALTRAIPQDSEDGLRYSSPPRYPSPWIQRQPEWGEAYDKAASFVQSLTLLEKVNLTTGVGMAGSSCLGNTGDIPRLGFRGLCLQDTPVFFATFAEFTSAFPSGLNVGATWDRDLAKARASAMSAEMKAKGADVYLRPVVSPLGRFPEGGRNWEGFGPDPYLSGELVGPTVEGIQSNGVMANVKHYIANEQEHFRRTSEASENGFNISHPISENLDDKTMHEIYLWPFANAIKAGAASVMCAYNQVNNSGGCENSYTLNHLLKEELGFPGFVLSDWGAHASGVRSAHAGLDMSMPGDSDPVSGRSHWGANLTLAVLNGTMSESRLDDMCMRIMTAFFKVGLDIDRPAPNFHSWQTNQVGPTYLFSPLSPIEEVNQDVYVRENHKQLIREIGAASIVLLKNVNKTLPLTGQERRIALFGRDAGSNQYGVNGCQDRGCNNGTLGQGWGSGSFLFPYLVSPEQALTLHVSQNTQGSISTITNEYNAVDQIVTLAGQATTSIVFVNSNSGEGYLTFENNYGDRNNITLWGNGEGLIKQVASNCPNTIVVIHSGGPVLVSSFHENPNVTAILWAGMPGQESGNSLVDVLYGRHNPSGKLPFTLGETRASYGEDHVILDEPNNGNDAPQQDISGLDLDYRHFDRHNITPLYEFGFGLSYSGTFQYSNLEVSPILPAASNPYLPSRGMTSSTPSIGKNKSPRLTNDNDAEILAEYGFPPADELLRQRPYVYPYLEESMIAPHQDDSNGLYGAQGRPPSSSYHAPSGANDTSPQPIPPAGGGLGGNPSLWEPVYRVRAMIANPGSIPGYEVAQLYITLLDGAEEQPPRMLRGFDRVYIPGNKKTEEEGEGGIATFEATLLRRDVSTWNVVKQDWEEHARFEVFVGRSSRDLPLRMVVEKPSDE